jgi:hypothetical protein
VSGALAPPRWGAIDPGVHALACADFERDGLLDAFFAPADLPVALGRTAAFVAWTQVIVEKPQLDGRVMRGGAAIGTLIDLAFAAGVGAGAARCKIVTYTPQEWKRSARKPQHHHAAWRALSVLERGILGGASTAALIDIACEKGAADGWRKPGADYYGRSKAARVHNLLDAVFLGLFHCGRIAITGAPR